MTGPHERITTRMRVHEAALELFLAHGYEGTSLQTIADRLSITKAAIYYYYRTKGDLLKALLSPVWDELTKLISETKTSLAPARHDLGLLEAYVDMLIRQRRLVLLLDRDPGVRSQPAVQSGLLPLRRQLEQLILGDEADEDSQLGLLIMRAGVCEVFVTFTSWDDKDLRVALLPVAHALLGRRRLRSRPKNIAIRPNTA
jgi:AcrR family transcriptional regulator